MSATEEKLAGINRVLDAAALPLGAIIATCAISRAARITTETAAQLRELNPREHAFGDYTPGRWAWVLTDVRPLTPPRPFRGSQGAFDVPDDLVGETSAQGVLL